ncbi:hypothetical protein PLAN_120313 [Planktothrix rubescens CCAP 1459/22]|uniref:Uncharacterized protein n=1 Tax=Planktothrix rubescens CCAP 1459/22 TaxID=329571 RepID=A0A6J7ZGU9_PLARU|nr:hypothetical protein PLAN_120313 [Planktothrix rubescens NIVA-CYA 18]
MLPMALMAICSIRVRKMGRLPRLNGYSTILKNGKSYGKMPVKRQNLGDGPQLPNSYDATIKGFSAVTPFPPLPSIQWKLQAPGKDVNHDHPLSVIIYSITQSINIF